VTSKTALFALLAMWGVGPCIDTPAMAEEAASTEAADQTPLKRSFTNRVWVKTESGELPGVMRIFLSDGTLVQDSCWETHRLSKWTMTGDTGITWNEDGMDIPATIVSVNSTELHLQLELGGGKVDEYYTTATVPYVCPDVPKG
jgi:hypothetical protein